MGMLIKLGVRETVKVVGGWLDWELGVRSLGGIWCWDGVYTRREFDFGGGLFLVMSLIPPADVSFGALEDVQSEDLLV
jgi:hypothetical protein